MKPLMKQIGIINRCALLYRENELQGTELTGCQVPYLLCLYSHPGISQEEMAQELDVNKSSVTRHLASMEEKGYVRRETGEMDRRVIRVYPTDKAMALREQLRDVLTRWSVLLTEDFSPEERETLSRLLSRAAEKAEKYVHGGGTACAPSDGT